MSELIPHLFRTEAGKITASLCKHFGIEHIDVAEDITHDTFLRALEVWPFRGVPDNPVAWLYAVAKNKAINIVKREKKLHSIITKASVGDANRVEIDLTPEGITDSQLRMLFAVSHPSLAMEAQIALALRVLCGFGIAEIASAFLSNAETVNKRLLRAKKKLRDHQVKLELPGPSELLSRLESVQLTLYLLFNEGYYSETCDEIIREDLCFEALRLTNLLIDYEPTRTPSTLALAALMNFQASRLKARRIDGKLVLYTDQEEGQWNWALINAGAQLLHQATQGNHVSRYHLEASIAYWHTRKDNTEEKWESILHLYDLLLQLHYSPVAALNRTFAVWKVRGVDAAISAAEQLGLEGNPYYHILLGELYKEKKMTAAKEHFSIALKLVRTTTERHFIENKLSQFRDA